MFSSLSGPFGPTLGAPNTAGGGTLAGIDVQVAPVVGGVQGAFVTLSSFTQLDSWIDGAYTQDFWRAGNTIDDMTFVVTRERGTDRAEVWMYRPPASVLVPHAGNGVPGSYTAPTQVEIAADSYYDVRISVNSSLITPQYSSSTTTRIISAKGTIRRLASQFKAWSWSAVDSAVANYKLPRFNCNLSTNTIAVTSREPTASSCELTGRRAFSHDVLGGPNSGYSWYDSARNTIGGGRISSISLMHSWESFAISERVNARTGNLVDLEDALRKSAEYAGTMPQYSFLDTNTLKPHNPQSGSNRWWNYGSTAGQSNLAVPNAYVVPTRDNYGWDWAHMYNNGQVAFEATKDPYFALLQQINAFAALASTPGTIRIIAYKQVNPSYIPDGNTIPFYSINYLQERGIWWSLKEIIKSTIVSSKSPQSGFVVTSDILNQVISNLTTQHKNYTDEIDAAAAVPVISNSADNEAAVRFALKSAGCYSPWFSNSLATETDTVPWANYVVPYMNDYGVAALAYGLAAGFTGLQYPLEKVLTWTFTRINVAKGQRSTPGFGSQASSAPINPTVSNGGFSVNPLPYSTPAGWVNYWKTRSTAWTNFDEIKFDPWANPPGPAWFYVQRMLSPLAVVHQLNTAGVFNVRASEVSSTMSTVNSLLANSTKVYEFEAPHELYSYL